MNWSKSRLTFIKVVAICDLIMLEISEVDLIFFEIDN